MLIPLTIGKKSNGEPYTIDIASTPLLFLSYHAETQVPGLLSQLNDISVPYSDFNYHIISSRRTEAWGLDNTNARQFLRDEPETGFYNSRQQMLRSILEEMAYRVQVLKKNKIDRFSRYHSLNLWKEEKMSYRMLVVDDIWDLVQYKPSSVGLNLMKILLFGGNVGIHSVVASNLSYRNLLQHLISLHPELTEDLSRKYGNPYPTQLGALGHEIIYTPDNLIFYKKGSIGEMERLFG